MAAGHLSPNIDAGSQRVRADRRIRCEILIGAAMVLAVAAVLYGVYPYRRARIVAGPLVQVSADGTLLVAWQTAGATRSRLDVHLADAASQRPGSVVSPRPREALSIEPAGADGRFVAILPRVLTNRARFSYSLTTSMLLGDRSKGPWRISPPRVGSPFRFVVFGESGGAARPGTMAAAILKTEPHLVLHIGDLIYETGQWPGDYGGLYREQFCEPYEALISSVPFMPVIGGHEARVEGGGPFRRFFALPQDGPNGVAAGLSYWFDYGPARFVAIDTSAPAEAMQGRIVPWLRAVLGDTATSWKFVCMERSPYTGGPNPADENIQRILVPAFEAVGVDAVFSAGHHLYERTHPMVKGEIRPVSEGVVYVTTGAGGRGLSTGKQPLPPYVAACEDRSYSFTFVELDGGRLHMRQVGEYGQLIDDWWFAKPTR